MAYQTRSYKNNVMQHDSLQAAFAESKRDPQVWKISFDWPGMPDMCWRTKKRSNIWENEDCLINLSVEYANERDRHKVYWVWQSVLPDDNVSDAIYKKLNNGLITKEQATNLIDRANIRMVLTEQQFKTKFSIN